MCGPSFRTRKGMGLGGSSSGKQMKIIAENSSDRESVLLTCDDQEAALHDQTVLGSRWEAPRDMDVAYAYVTDRPGLIEELEREGYEVDSSEYFPFEKQA